MPRTDCADPAVEFRDGTVLSIQLMGELVQDQVSAILEVGRSSANIIPRKDDDPVGPGLPSVDVFTFESDAVPERLDGLGDVGAGVDEDRGQLGVDIGITVEQEQASLSGDGHLDLIVQHQSAATFEVFLGEQDLDEAVEFESVGLRKASVKAYVLLDDRQPVRWKRRGPQSIAFAA